MLEHLGCMFWLLSGFHLD